MKCSHDLQLEVNCPHCFSEAMVRMRALREAPPPSTASKEDRQAFWGKQYQAVHPEIGHKSEYQG